MEKFTIQKTKSTPFVEFDSEKGRIRIEGESYPENPVKFYEPIWDKLRDYLKSGIATHLEVDIELTYFNSSSSKALMNFFEMLETATINGFDVAVNWWTHPENESALEAGEEFKEDVPSLTFNLRQTQ